MNIGKSLKNKNTTKRTTDSAVDRMKSSFSTYLHIVSGNYLMKRTESLQRIILWSESFTVSVSHRDHAETPEPFLPAALSVFSISLENSSHCSPEAEIRQAKIFAGYLLVGHSLRSDIQEQNTNCLKRASHKNPDACFK